MGGRDQSWLPRNLDAKQKKALTLFEVSREVTAKDIAVLFGFQQQTASMLCWRWVHEGFLVTADAAKKSGRYRLSREYQQMFGQTS